MGRLFASLMNFRALLYLGRGDEALAAAGEASRIAGAEDTYFTELVSMVLRAHLEPLDEAEDGLRRLIVGRQR